MKRERALKIVLGGGGIARLRQALSHGDVCAEMVGTRKGALLCR